MGCLEKNPIFQRNKKAVLSASKLVANSEWMKAIMVRFFGREDITVVNPPIQVLNKSKGDGDEILFVGGSMRKGMRIFFEIAEKFPGRSFAIAGQPLLPKMPNNVRNYGELTDMGVAFRNAKLVLCLDQEPPAFNRVPREAYQYGIPVIASKSGGLPESVGDGGLLVPDFWFADAFAQAIEDLLDDQEKYLELQKKAQEMALKSDTANQFVDLVFGMGAG